MRKRPLVLQMSSKWSTPIKVGLFVMTISTEDFFGVIVSFSMSWTLNSNMRRGIERGRCDWYHSIAFRRTHSSPPV